MPKKSINFERWFAMRRALKRWVVYSFEQYKTIG
jgi:hypothetical protein